MTHNVEVELTLVRFLLLLLFTKLLSASAAEYRSVRLLSASGLLRLHINTNIVKSP